MCDRTFQSPTNRDAPRTEKHITYNQIDSVPMKRLTCYSSCNGPRKDKAHAHGDVRMVIPVMFCCEMYL